MKDDNYFTVKGWMVNKLGLSGGALIAYAVIYGFSQDGRSSFRGSMSYLASCAGVSERGIQKIIKGLVEKGYIAKREAEEDGRCNIYMAVDPKEAIKKTSKIGEQSSGIGEQSSLKIGEQSSEIDELCSEIGEQSSPYNISILNLKESDKDREEKQEEKTEASFSFSPTLSESLNPNMADFSQRLELLRGRYNDLKIGPPFRKTALNLSPPELSDLMKIMRVYPDDVSLGAMENYSKITNSPDHDPGGCVYRGFVSFMARGVEKYCGEAGPFELFRKKPGRYGGSSPPGGDWADFGEVSQGTVDIEALYRKFGITGTGPEKRRKLIELRDRGEVLF
jgi:DNA-binding MarR family transcriptional regulator